MKGYNVLLSIVLLFVPFVFLVFAEESLKPSIIRFVIAVGLSVANLLYQVIAEKPKQFGAILFTALAVFSALFI